MSEDRIRAYVETPGATAPGFTPPGEHEVIAALTKLGVLIDDGVRARVREYMALVSGATGGSGSDGPPEIPRRFLIAEGLAPVEARDGEFVPDASLENKSVENVDEDERIDYYSRNSILTIEAGKIVGKVKDPVGGIPGRDVLGNEAKPRKTKGRPLVLGNGLRLLDDGSGRVETTVAGRLEPNGAKIRMSEILEIPCDVDFKSGNVDCVTDVHIRGMVKPNFSVKSTKSVTIDKAAESAELVAGGDLVVRGGVFGQESGKLIKAGGDITMSICDGARVEAGGDVLITREVINSNLRVDGRLELERGSIIGSEVYARNGVTAKSIGSQAGVVTRVSVGMDAAVLLRARALEKEAEKLEEQCEQIRNQVQPLIANTKRLTPAQREMASVMMCKAEELAGPAEEHREKRRAMIETARPSETPAVNVSGALCAGVVIAFGVRESRVKTALKGPLRVEEQRVNGTTEIVVVEPSSGAMTVLPSSPVDPKRFAAPKDKNPGAANGTERK